MHSLGPTKQQPENAVSEPVAGVVQLVQPILISPHARLFSEFLIRAGYKDLPGPGGPPVPEPITEPEPEVCDTSFDHGLNVAASYAEPATERIENPTLRKRWTAVDEHACRKRCKWCSQPVQWGRIESDTADQKSVGRWVTLDPDGMPHNPCRAQDADKVPVLAAEENEDGDLA